MGMNERLYIINNLYHYLIKIYIHIFQYHFAVHVRIIDNDYLYFICYKSNYVDICKIYGHVQMYNQRSVDKVTQLYHINKRIKTREMLQKRKLN